MALRSSTASPSGRSTTPSAPRADARGDAHARELRLGGRPPGLANRPRPHHMAVGAARTIATHSDTFGPGLRGANATCRFANLGLPRQSVRDVVELNRC